MHACINSKHEDSKNHTQASTPKRTILSQRRPNSQHAGGRGRGRGCGGGHGDGVSTHACMHGSTQIWQLHQNNTHILQSEAQASPALRSACLGRASMMTATIDGEQRRSSAICSKFRWLSASRRITGAGRYVRSRKQLGKSKSKPASKQATIAKLVQQSKHTDRINTQKMQNAYSTLAWHCRVVSWAVKKEGRATSQLWFVVFCFGFLSSSLSVALTTQDTSTSARVVPSTII